ncbi:glycosyltransferase family A protein [Leeuwenhoekiella parthenopeia]|uniref:Glycosyltransferase family 2 protein n=1 Tax=Leeuwenhoekiella parthenopeia TaxID=2890320 RepID=A0ABS8GXX2_9FLAO|nr:glycosyltransferase family A protein [Leeuwenhoekiella parthenopeia]MCC4214653.1 glycosyltransferase family 2 protein [Leeuwenhoekiella parthenopeia]
MRNGVNPQKLKNEKLPLFLHRVIVPVYIPNLEDAYYRNHLEVFEKFLDQIIRTINLQTTAITLINNNSCAEIAGVIDKYRSTIDKLVWYAENKGKVFPVLQEARSAAEPFITITDADVLFYEGWEQAVFKVFASCPKAGVVAPLPSPALAFYENTAVFSDHYLSGGINYKKVMSDADAEHYLKGMGNEALLNRENRVFSWKEKQYFLKDSHAIIGAGHFVATYRSSLFKGTYKYPKLKFKNGLEREYIDMLSDQRGFYRLSTVETYAYHLGNILDESLPTFSRGVNRLEPELIQKAFQNEKPSILPYRWRIILFKILKRLYKL